MIITSPGFMDNSQIPDKYAYRGENISPPLVFDEIPGETVSLALICHDPDAPRPGGFTHWVMWNIDPSTNELAENTIPEGAVIGLTDFGENDWGGPAPPLGTHRYIFYVYALDKILDLPTSTERTELLNAIEPHVIDSATLTGLYSAKR